MKTERNVSASSNKPNFSTAEKYFNIPFISRNFRILPIQFGTVKETSVGWNLHQQKSDNIKEYFLTEFQSWKRIGYL